MHNEKQEHMNINNNEKQEHMNINSNEKYDISTNVVAATFENIV
jgi:hypothetical protein